MTEGTVEFQSKICLFLLLSGCLPMCVPTCMLGAPRRPEKGIRSPGARVTDGVSYPVGSGNGILVLCKSSQCLSLLSPLSRTKHLILTSRKIEDRE